MSANPQNPLAGGFIGSFITVNGKTLSQHFQDVGRIVQGIESVPANAAPQLMNNAKDFAQKIVPVRTGFLRSSIDWEQISRFVFSFFARASYARAVEEGTFRMPARPYMMPAIQRLRQQAPQVIINQMRSIFK